LNKLIAKSQLPKANHQMQIKYNPKGMNKDELLEFVQLEAPIHPRSVSEAEVYGAGKYLRKYGNYPKSWPIKVYVSHGPSQWDFVEPRLIPSYHNYNAFFSDRLVQDFKNKSHKKVFKILAPFVMCRRLNNIQQAVDVKGSLFFFAHSTEWTDFKTNYEKILAEFEKLPKEFLPISVCMHFMDIKRDRHHFFIDKGIPVFTAGNWKNPFFADNFYEIIRHFKFTLTNSISSNIFYSIEMGIPASFIDVEPEITENTEKEFMGEENPIKKHKQMQRNYRIFSGIHTSITDEQKQITIEELGLVDGISRINFSFLLYYSLILKFYHKTIFLFKHTLKKIALKLKKRKDDYNQP